MALTEEQRSMLQLLLQGQSYEDIGSLLGVGADDVRSRSRAALQEMGGADPDSRVGLTDFLLGQADPIGRADAVRHLQNDPEANALAERLVAQLRLVAPQAELPEVPPARGGRRAQPAPPPAPRPAAPGAPPPEPPTDQQPGLPGRIFGGLGGRDNQAKLLVGIGAAALLIVAVVLVIVLSGDDGGGDEQAADTGTTTTAQGSEDLAIVQLAPISGDSQASGQAVLAQVQNQPVLQLNLNGLAPTGQGQTYIVWLYASNRAAFPLARDQVGDNGSLTGAAAIPNEVVPLLGQFGCVDVSLASSKATEQALQQAVEGETLPAHTGETVLRGQIPTAVGQQAPSGADAQCDIAPAGGGGGGTGGGAGGGGGGGAGNG